MIENHKQLEQDIRKYLGDSNVTIKPNTKHNERSEQGIAPKNLTNSFSEYSTPSPTAPIKEETDDSLQGIFREGTEQLETKASPEHCTFTTPEDKSHRTEELNEYPNDETDDFNNEWSIGNTSNEGGKNRRIIKRRKTSASTTKAQELHKTAPSSVTRSKKAQLETVYDDITKRERFLRTPQKNRTVTETNTNGNKKEAKLQMNLVDYMKKKVKKYASPTKR